MAGVDDAESVALGIGEHDEVVVARVAVPLHVVGSDHGRSEANYPVIIADRNRSGAAGYAVIALISSAIFSENSFDGNAVCMAIIFIMSPWTLILPFMNACIATVWS